MKIGSQVKLRDDGPIYEIVDVEFKIYETVRGFAMIHTMINEVTKIKVDIEWYTPEQFNERFRILEGE